jgi:hypothetical protein
MFMGNLLATVMTISLPSVIMNTAVKITAALFTAVIYFSLVFVPAYKDGVNEKNLLQKNQGASVVKFRWLAVGFVLSGIMAVPAVLLLTGNIGLGLYRIIDGAVYPLSLLLIPTAALETGEVPVYAPFIFMGFYLLTAPVCEAGFFCGYKDKLNLDKILYKK